MKLCLASLLAGMVMCLNAKPLLAAQLTSNVDGISFSSPLEQIYGGVDIEFGNYTGPVFFCNCDNLSLRFVAPVQSFSFYLEPNTLSLVKFDFSEILQNGDRSYSNQSIFGAANPPEIDFTASNSAIASIQISSADLLDQGFALGEFNAIASPESAPEPSNAIALLVPGALLLNHKKKHATN